MEKKRGERIVYFPLFLFLFFVPLILWRRTYNYTLIKLLVSQVLLIFFLILILKCSGKACLATTKMSLRGAKPRGNLKVSRLLRLWLAMTGGRDCPAFSFSSLTLLLLPYLFSILLSLLFSNNLSASQKGLVRLLTYISIFLFASNISFYRKEMVYLFLSSSLILSLWAIIQYFLKGYAIASFGNPNFLAGFLIFPLCLSLSLLFSCSRSSCGSRNCSALWETSPDVDIKVGRPFPHEDKGQGKPCHYILRERIFLLITFLSCAIAISLTKSLAAFLGLLAGILFLFFCSRSSCGSRNCYALWETSPDVDIVRRPFPHEDKGQGKPCHYKNVIASPKGVAISIIFLIFLSILLRPVILNRINTDIRPPLWNGTIRMISEKPFFGWGLGNYILSYQQFRTTDYFNRPASAPVTDHSHNEYLEIASEKGIFGLLSFLLFISAFFFFLIKTSLSLREPMEWRQADSSATPQNDKRSCRACSAVIARGKASWQSQGLLLGMGAGILAILVDNLFSTNLRNCGEALFFWFGLGFASSFFKKRFLSKKSSFFLYSLLLSLLLFSTTIFFLQEFRSNLYYRKAVLLREKEDFKGAIKFYQKTIKSDISNPFAYYRLGYAYLKIGEIDKAISAYQSLYKISPYFSFTDFNLGVLYKKKGESRKSLYYFLKSDAHNPYYIPAICSLASFYLQKENSSLGKKYLKRSLIIDPQNEFALKCLKQLKEDERKSPK